MKRFAILLPVVLLAGCQSISDMFSTQRYISPEAWVPRVEAGFGEEVSTDPAVVTRSLKQGDPVIVNMTVNLRPQPRVEDVIDEEGNISLPILGEFKVAGLTTAEAERAIKQAYLDNNVYRDVTVNVICTAAQARIAETYSITGAVKRIGRYNLPEGLTLRQAVIASGDANDFATGKILITRNGVTNKFNYRRICKGLDPDPDILNGDIIEVCK